MLIYRAKRIVVRSQPCLKIDPLVELRRCSSGRLGCNPAWPREEAPAARRCTQPAVLNDHLATAKHAHRPALHGASRPWRIAGTTSDRVISEGHPLPGIPDGNVGVGADSDLPLPGVKTIDFRWLSRRPRDEPGQIEPALG